MDGMRTRGQPVAVTAIRAMLGSGFPHAVLLTGPGGVGKTTLALDIAMALMCGAMNAAERPCGECRGCRMVEHGNHPDVHRLAPVGAGAQISIGGREDRGVRDLVRDLAYLPVEGGMRVAIVEAAQRMTEDAQSAFLKTLEEPPPRTTIILCADDEERLMPTIRSRVARVRLGPIGPRDIEAVLVAQGVADAPTASRLARFTDGRPGHAISYARAPEAVVIRGEIARTLLDLLDGGVTSRLAGLRDLAGRAAELTKALDAGAIDPSTAPPLRGSRGRRKGPVASDPGASESSAGDGDSSAGAPEDASDARPAKVPAADRRRAALALLDIWRAVLRDLGLVIADEREAIRDQDLIDDLVAVATRLDLATVGQGLRRLELAGERLEGNVSPELVLDVLALHWAPSRAA